MKAQWIKPWTTPTRDSDFSKELHNILDEQFNPDRPNAVWCTDITYIWTHDGFVYLNCIMGLFAKKIIAWRKATETMQRSYSHSGYPYDNACMESFHSLIKREWLNRFHILNYRHAYRRVFEYIETFYNTTRIHSHCDYMSPDEYEKLYERVMSLPAA